MKFTRYLYEPKQTMIVLTKKRLTEFAVSHPHSKGALDVWYRIVKEADWSNFNQMRMVFGSVDAVGNDLYVFNIRGNEYRLIVRIIFQVRTVFIKFIGTHKQYNDINLSRL